MSKATNIFILGATGYIGGSILLRFINRPDFATLNVTALVRSQEKAGKLNLLGVHTIVGSFDDLPLLENAASKADVVINAADADDLDVVRALLKGLEQRHETTGNVPSYIHTSGTGEMHTILLRFTIFTSNTGVLCDTAGGMYAYETIYNDEDPDQIETLAPTQMHRLVDLATIEADKKGTSLNISR
ncbi:hypothetical protein DXG01_009567 [Tephrocybe rancida]|nr:hypothetical protein DXG01_009567 [Tephrocybe rancida]